MKRRSFHRRYTPAGSAPGTFHKAEDAQPTSIHVIAYDAERVDEDRPATAEGAARWRQPGRTAWVDVTGLRDHELIAELGRKFGLHPLALADVVNTGQRPKVEEFGDTLFFVVRMAMPGAAGGEVRWEQTSMFLGDGFVVTFQEYPGDCLEPLRVRLRQGRPMVRTAGVGYLGVMIVDAVVDGYFPVLEALGERLDALEEELVHRPGRGTLADVYRIKRELMAFRRAVWPLRDTLSQLLRDQHPKLGAAVMPYVRDTADHTMQLVDVVETYRELAASFVDVYLSSVAHRTNEIMRVLTVISTIFIPLTFLSGVYGMNFDTTHAANMPELRWPFGYAAFWIVCLVLSLVMLGAFRRLGWLRRKR